MAGVLWTAEPKALSVELMTSVAKIAFSFCDSCVAIWSPASDDLGFVLRADVLTVRFV